MYRGRFAPSPTGSLHLGSLYTAVASFLEARSRQGQWLLRIDDADIPRNVKGAADDILKTLDIFGLHWDEAVFYQSQQQSHYQVIIEQLKQQDLIYPCICSRKTLATASNHTIYPQFCRDKSIPTDKPHALRIKTNA
ncbi:MAG: tRNA glutamyl-Q(34) synthetase GluQRS, partial [Methylococcaceae bacterium]|nr:tRNA glutamyl-Q(34) synthetase GluQRS [Methylococcaceae bacterium]